MCLIRFLFENPTDSWTNIYKPFFGKEVIFKKYNNLIFN